MLKAVWLLASLLVAPRAGTLQLSMVDKSFLGRIVSAHNYHLKAAALAQEHTGTPTLRPFADLMVAEHTRMRDELRALVARESRSVRLPAGVDARAQARLDALGKAGGSFARVYKEQMVGSHAEMLSLFSTYLKDKYSTAAVKRLVTRARPILAAHLAQAKTLPDW